MANDPLFVIFIRMVGGKNKFEEQSYFYRADLFSKPWLVGFDPLKEILSQLLG